MSATNNNINFETTLTEGSIWKRMVAFAIPLFFGNLFQQLYNIVDSLIGYSNAVNFNKNL